MKRLLRRVDAKQQEFGPAAFVLGVVKKFGDDNAGTLVTNLAYSGFVCVFPLLLILVTVLNLALAGDAGLRKSLLHSALGEFPIIGPQLGGNVHSVQHSSVIGLVIGILGLIWGSTGLAQAGVFSMSQVWNIPGTERPNFASRLGRSLLFLVVLGLGLLVSTFLAGLGTFGHHVPAAGVISEVLAVLVNVMVFLLVFRVLTSHSIRTRDLVPGACVGGVAWTVLQALGGYLIGHDLRNASALYGVFGVVLGLIAWIYLGSELTIYSAEVNVVLARRLWPRGMVQPPLTEADQRSLGLQATQNRRHPEEDIKVVFDRPPMSQSTWLQNEGDEDKDTAPTVGGATRATPPAEGGPVADGAPNRENGQLVATPAEPDHS
jgi:YihY family inner membrane protein